MSPESNIFVYPLSPYKLGHPRIGRGSVIAGQPSYKHLPLPLVFSLGPKLIPVLKKCARNSKTVGNNRYSLVLSGLFAF